jgi:hypothetical protein
VLRGCPATIIAPSPLYQRDEIWKRILADRTDMLCDGMKMSMINPIFVEGLNKKEIKYRKKVEFYMFYRYPKVGGYGAERLEQITLIDQVSGPIHARKQVSLSILTPTDQW